MRSFFLSLTLASLALATACAGFRPNRSEVEMLVALESVPIEPSMEEDLSLDQVLGADTLLADGPPDKILQEAERRYEAVVILLAQGDTLSAHAAMDEILGLLIGAGNSEEDEVVSGRENLLKRLSALIGKRPADQRALVERKGDIPRIMNDRVEKQIRWFRQKNPAGLAKSYARAGQYADVVHQELALRGLPEELKWLPIIESSYVPYAQSWAEAVGLWQFILDTGKRYGLKRTPWVDDRLDPYKATPAAAAYLSDLHDMFGDWLLALAAYNCGEARVLRAVNRYGNDFWKLKLPGETMDYVPRFLAAVIMLDHPEQYGLKLPSPMPSYLFEETRIEKSIALADAARVLDVPADLMKTLNGGVRAGITPPEGYDIRVPLGMGSTLMTRLNDIPEAKMASLPEARVYRVRRGDTLSQIANRFNTSVNSIKQMNKLRGNIIHIGQTLKVPGRTYAIETVASAVSTAPEPVETSVEKSEPSSYRVRKGDTLFSIARRHGTTVEHIKALNGLRGNSLQAGQTLTLSGTRIAESSSADLNIRTEATVTSTTTYKVRRGDTLGSIARAHGVTVDALKNANPKVKPSRLMVNQRIIIPGVISTDAGRPETTLASFHTVKQGESLWTIARMYGLSVAQMMKLNSLRRASVIQPGQRLKVATTLGQEQERPSSSFTRAATATR